MAQMRSCIAVNLLCLLAVCVPLIAQEPGTITVRPGESIQAAIDAAPEGAVICLGAGEWEENLVIEKSLSLRGAGPESTVIRSRRANTAVLAVTALERTALKVEIARLAVTGGRGDFGVRITAFLGTAHVEVRDCAVYENTAGLSVVGSIEIILEKCAIAANRSGTGIALGSSVQTGVTRASLAACTVSGSYHGVWLSSGAQVTFSDCTILGNTDFGIGLNGTAVGEVLRSVSTANTYGILAGGRASLTVRDSVLAENKYGILVEADAEGVVEGNEIRANTFVGVSGSSSKEVVGHGNLMIDNAVDLVGNLSGQLRIPLVDATEMEVNYPDPRYPTLQHAVDSLLPGGKLLIGEGIHPAGVTIGRSVMILPQVGSSPTLTTRLEDSLVLSAVGDTLLDLSDLTVAGGIIGIVLGGSTRTTITGCTVKASPEYGVLLVATAEALIADCDISGADRVGIGCGVGLGSSAQATIRNCTLNKNIFGIRAASSSQATIDSCVITENGRGIVLEGSTRSTVQACSVTGNMNGVWVQDQAWTLLRENVIVDNTRYGVCVSESPCFQTRTRFTGYVSGRANIITGSGRADVCPDDLAFLLTEEGGELDLRE